MSERDCLDELHFHGIRYVRVAIRYEVESIFIPSKSRFPMRPSSAVCVVCNVCHCSPQPNARAAVKELKVGVVGLRGKKRMAAMRYEKDVTAPQTAFWSDPHAVALTFADPLRDALLYPNTSGSCSEGS